MPIPFTQYLRPDGREIATSIDRPAEVEQLAQVVIRSGARFESEVLANGTISLECVGPEDDDGDRDSLAIELSENGPTVLDAVDRLVRAAHARVAATAPEAG
jgi:hypothetical protein